MICIITRHALLVKFDDAASLTNNSLSMAIHTFLIRFLPFFVRRRHKPIILVEDICPTFCNLLVALKNMKNVSRCEHSTNTSIGALKGPLEPSRVQVLFHLPLNMGLCVIVLCVIRSRCMLRHYWLGALKAPLEPSRVSLQSWCYPEDQWSRQQWWEISSEAANNAVTVSEVMGCE